MRYYSEETVKKIMEGVKVDYVPTSQYDSSLCTEKRTYPKLENYPSIEMPSPWHTGKLIEKGWYLLKYKYKGCSDYIYKAMYFEEFSELPDIVKWQKIKED